MWVVISAGQFESAFPARRDQGGEGHRCGGTRLQPHRRANRKDRIQHRAGGSRKHAHIAKGGGRSSGPPAPEKLRTIRLAGDRPYPILSSINEMDSPKRLLGRRAGAPRRRDGRTPVVPLGLHEEITKGGVGTVGARRSENDLPVTGDLDFPDVAAVVDDRNATNLCRILRDDGDLGQRLDRAVGAAEADPVRSEESTIPIRRGCGGLVCG